MHSKPKEVVQVAEVDFDGEISHRLEIAKQEPVTVNTEAIEPEPPVVIRVIHMDGAETWHVPFGGWKKTVHNELVLGHDVPRTHIPLTNVRFYEVLPREV